jgi:hypothetical protein
MYNASCLATTDKLLLDQQSNVALYFGRRVSCLSQARVSVLEKQPLLMKYCDIYKVYTCQILGL